MENNTSLVSILYAHLHIVYTQHMYMYIHTYTCVYVYVIYIYKHIHMLCVYVLYTYVYIIHVSISNMLVPAVQTSFPARASPDSLHLPTALQRPNLKHSPMHFLSVVYGKYEGIWGMGVYGRYGPKKGAGRAYFDLLQTSCSASSRVLGSTLIGCYLRNWQSFCRARKRMLGLDAFLAFHTKPR